MKRSVWLFILTMLFGVIAYPADRGTFDFVKNGGRRPMKAALGIQWAKRVQQGYSMKLWLSNQMSMGIEAWDPYTVPPNSCSGNDPGVGLEYPSGTCVEHLYGAGPMIGGIINGVRHVTEGYNGDDARMEFLPEKQDTARDKIWRTNFGQETFHPNGDGYSGYYYNHQIQVNRRGCDDDGDGKVDEDDLDGQDNDGDWNPLTDDIGADGLPDSAEVSCDGKRYDPSTNPDPAYDNYNPAAFDKCRLDGSGNYLRKRDKDKYTQNNGIPDHGEPHVDEDYAALSDQDIYLAATDTFKSYNVPGHVSMGVKIFQKTYAWQESFADGIIPMDYYFVNIGKNSISQVYVGFFADFDVGPVSVGTYASDDYACYMPDLRCGYIHNAVDRGSTPAGIVVLGTPKPLDQLKYVWQWHGFTNPGTIDTSIYSWMIGEPFPDALIKPCQSPSGPTDTRFFFSFGPFDVMNPGDTLKITIAMVSGEGVEAGPHNLRENAENAIKLFSRGFLAPITLPSPKLQVTNLIDKPYGVKLEWGPHLNKGGINPLDVWDDSNRIAQAFPDTSWRRINPPCGEGVGGCAGGHRCFPVYDSASGTYKNYLTGGRIFEGYRLYRSEDPEDIQKNDWTLVRQWDMKADQYGFNVGIDTVFYDTNLVRGKKYWYSVTSYGLPDLTVIPVKDAQGNFHYDTLLAENTESSLIENQTSVTIPFSVSDRKGDVLVVPNPYRTDRDYTYENGGWEGSSGIWTESKRLVKFIHLPSKCTIRVFTLAGDLVTTIEHNDPSVGEVTWNLLSQSNRALASGIYIFTVESDFGRQIGKFVLIR